MEHFVTPYTRVVSLSEAMPYLGVYTEYVRCYVIYVHYFIRIFVQTDIVCICIGMYMGWTIHYMYSV